jgi:hypothetical protein
LKFDYRTVEIVFAEYRSSLEEVSKPFYVTRTVSKGEIEVDVHNNLNSLKIASFKILEFPSSPKVAITRKILVETAYRKKGVGTILNHIIQTIAKAGGADCLICTVNDGNVAQKKIMERTGWTNLITFPTGDHLLGLWSTDMSGI